MTELEKVILGLARRLEENAENASLNELLILSALKEINGEIKELKDLLSFPVKPYREFSDD